MQSQKSDVRDNKCSCKITGVKHTRACNQREYRQRLKLKSLRVNNRYHEHMITDNVVSVPVIATKSGVYCAICGFSPSTYAVNYAVTTMQSLGIV